MKESEVVWIPMNLLFVAINLWWLPLRKNQDKQILSLDYPWLLRGEFGCSSWRSRSDRIGSVGSTTHSTDWFWSFWDLGIPDTFPWVAIQLHILLHPQTRAHLLFSSASRLSWLFHLPYPRIATRFNPPSSPRHHFQLVPPSCLPLLFSPLAARFGALGSHWEYLRLHEELLAWRRDSNPME